MSRYIKIRCNKCGEERIVFGNSTRNIRCNKCKTQITKSTGSRAKIINAKVIKVL